MKHLSLVWAGLWRSKPESFGSLKTALAVAWCFFNGSSVSSLTGTSPSPLTYSLDVSPSLIAFGMVCACAIGLLGGLFPAIRAARVSVASAIRRT